MPIPSDHITFHTIPRMISFLLCYNYDGDYLLTMEGRKLQNEWTNRYERQARPTY